MSYEDFQLELSSLDNAENPDEKFGEESEKKSSSEVKSMIYPKTAECSAVAKIENKSTVKSSSEISCKNDKGATKEKLKGSSSEKVHSSTSKRTSHSKTSQSHKSSDKSGTETDNSFSRSSSSTKSDDIKQHKSRGDRTKHSGKSSKSERSRSRSSSTSSHHSNKSSKIDKDHSRKSSDSCKSRIEAISSSSKVSHKEAEVGGKSSSSPLVQQSKNHKSKSSEKQASESSVSDKSDKLKKVQPEKQSSLQSTTETCQGQEKPDESKHLSDYRKKGHRKEKSSKPENSDVKKNTEKSSSIKFQKSEEENQPGGNLDDVSRKSQKAQDMSKEKEKSKSVSKRTEKPSDVSQKIEKADTVLNKTAELDVSKNVEKSVDIHKKVDKSVDIPKTVDKTVDMPKKNEKSVDISKKADKSVDMPKKNEKSVDIPKMVEKSADIAKNVETSVVILKKDEKSVDIPKKVEKSVDILKKVDNSVDISKKVDKSVDIPKKVDKSVDIPKKVDKSVDIPKKVDKSVDIPKKVEKSIDIPKKVEKLVGIKKNIEKSAKEFEKSEVSKRNRKSADIPLEVQKSVDVPKVIENSDVSQKGGEKSVDTPTIGNQQSQSTKLKVKKTRSGDGTYETINETKTHQQSVTEKDDFPKTIVVNDTSDKVLRQCKSVDVEHLEISDEDDNSFGIEILSEKIGRRKSNKIRSNYNELMKSQTISSDCLDMSSNSSADTVLTSNLPVSVFQQQKPKKKQKRSLAKVVSKKQPKLNLKLGNKPLIEECTAPAIDVVQVIEDTQDSDDFIIHDIRPTKHDTNMMKDPFESVPLATKRVRGRKSTAGRANKHHSVKRQVSPDEESCVSRPLLMTIINPKKRVWIRCPNVELEDEQFNMNPHEDQSSLSFSTKYPGNKSPRHDITEQFSLSPMKGGYESLDSSQDSLDVVIWRKRSKHLRRKNWIEESESELACSTDCGSPLVVSAPQLKLNSKENTFDLDKKVEAATELRVKPDLNPKSQPQVVLTNVLNKVNNGLFELSERENDYGMLISVYIPPHLRRATNLFIRDTLNTNQNSNGSLSTSITFDDSPPSPINKGENSSSSMLKSIPNSRASVKRKQASTFSNVSSSEEELPERRRKRKKSNARKIVTNQDAKKSDTQKPKSLPLKRNFKKNLPSNLALKQGIKSVDSPVENLKVSKGNKSASDENMIQEKDHDVERAKTRDVEKNQSTFCVSYSIPKKKARKEVEEKQTDDSKLQTCGEKPVDSKPETTNKNRVTVEDSFSNYRIKRRSVSTDISVKFDPELKKTLPGHKAPTQNSDSEKYFKPVGEKAHRGLGYSLDGQSQRRMSADSVFRNEGVRSPLTSKHACDSSKEADVSTSSAKSACTSQSNFYKQKTKSSLKTDDSSSNNVSGTKTSFDIDERQAVSRCELPRLSTSNLHMYESLEPHHRRSSSPSRISRHNNASPLSFNYRQASKSSLSICRSSLASKSGNRTWSPITWKEDDCKLSSGNEDGCKYTGRKESFKSKLDRNDEKDSSQRNRSSLSSRRNNTPNSDRNQGESYGTRSKNSPRNIIRNSDRSKSLQSSKNTTKTEPMSNKDHKINKSKKEPITKTWKSWHERRNETSTGLKDVDMRKDHQQGNAFNVKREQFNSPTQVIGESIKFIEKRDSIVDYKDVDMRVREQVKDKSSVTRDQESGLLDISGDANNSFDSVDQWQVLDAEGCFEPPHGEESKNEECGTGYSSFEATEDSSGNTYLIRKESKSKNTPPPQTRSSSRKVSSSPRIPTWSRGGRGQKSAGRGGHFSAPSNASKWRGKPVLPSRANYGSNRGVNRRDRLRQRSRNTRSSANMKEHGVTELMSSLALVRSPGTSHLRNSIGSLYDVDERPRYRDFHHRSKYDQLNQTSNEIKDTARAINDAKVNLHRIQGLQGNAFQQRHFNDGAMFNDNNSMAANNNSFVSQQPFIFGHASSFNSNHQYNANAAEANGRLVQQQGQFSRQVNSEQELPNRLAEQIFLAQQNETAALQGQITQQLQCLIRVAREKVQTQNFINNSFQRKSGPNGQDGPGSGWC